MLWRKTVLVLVLIGLAFPVAAQPAAAGNPFDCASDAWYCFWRDWKRNNCWPEPFVCPDRAAVRMPFAIQIANGWRDRNTLDGLYFEEDGTELSALGQERIRYLLMNTPCAYRTIYVLAVCDPAVTSARLAAVQNAVNDACGGEMPVPVMLTSQAPSEYSGEEANLVRQKYHTWVVDPKQIPRVMGDLDPGSSSSSSGN